MRLCDALRSCADSLRMNAFTYLVIARNVVTKQSSKTFPYEQFWIATTAALSRDNDFSKDDNIIGPHCHYDFMRLSKVKGRYNTENNNAPEPNFFETNTERNFVIVNWQS